MRSVVKAIDDAKLREITEQLEHAEASTRAAVEHPFRVLKRQFGYVKMRYKRLAKSVRLVPWTSAILPAVDSNTR